MITSLRTTIMAAFCMAALAVVGVADAANEKERVRDRFGGTYELAVDCAPYGYAFEVLVAGSERGSITDVLDGEGNLLRTVLHISLEETNVTSVAGRTLALKGHARSVWDYTTNVRTVTGLVFMGKAAEGKAFQDTGRIDISIDTSEALFVAGPHDVFFGGGIDQIACETLAAP